MELCAQGATDMNSQIIYSRLCSRMSELESMTHQDSCKYTFVWGSEKYARTYKEKWSKSFLPILSYTGRRFADKRERLQPRWL